MDSGSCLQTYSLHSEAVRDARWSPCGQRILSGGFDSALHLTDLETGVFLCFITPRRPLLRVGSRVSFLTGEVSGRGILQPPAADGFRAGADGTRGDSHSASVSPGCLPETETGP